MGIKFALMLGVLYTGVLHFAAPASSSATGQAAAAPESPRVTAPR